MITESPTISVPNNQKTQGFQYKMKMFLGTLCGLLFIFVVVLSLPVYVFRIVVIVLAKLFRPDLGSILNGISSYLVNDYFYNKISPRANIVVSLYLQGRDWSVNELKERLMEQWINATDSKTGKPKFEQFQQYPERWLGFTFYKHSKNTFDINNHVHIHDRANPNMDFVDDEVVNNICEKLMNEPYKPCSSLWEVHFVNNYKSDKTKAFDPNEKAHVLIFKFHHSLADGYSILTAIVEGFGQQNLTNFEFPEPSFPKRNIKQKLIYSICYPFKFMYDFSYFMSHMFKSSPWKIPDDKKEWYQHCAKSDFIPIEKVKFIKSKLGVSFTSVLLYSISSAIQKSLPNSKANNLNTSENHFRPVNLEDKDYDKFMFCMSLLPLPGHSRGLTNHVTMALFDLPLGSNGNVISGLRAVDQMLDTAKKSCIPVCVPLYLAVVGWHFYPVGKFIGKQRMHHTGLSNFPSLPIEIYENDRKCYAVDFMTGGLDGLAGVAVFVLSYGENIRFAVTAEKAVLSKVEIAKFTSYITDEINHLYNEASLECNGNRTDRLHDLNKQRKIEPFHTAPIQVV